jgi:hypothetical protein
MTAPRTKSDGFVRGWHPDQRAKLPAGGSGGKRCKHPPERVHAIHNSNGDEIEWCELCDRSWWVRAT